MQHHLLRSEIVVVIGAGAIAQAIARRVGVGKQLLLADISNANAEQAAQHLRQAGFAVHCAQVDVADRASVQQLAEQAAQLGAVTGLIHTAGVSPSQASAQKVLQVDLYGTAIVLEAFGDIIAPNGVGIVIGSQSSHRLPIDALSAAQADALATLPAEQLLELDFVQAIDDSLLAYQIAKKGNALRVAAQAVQWGKRHARLNCISAGIVFTPLAYDELTSATRGEFYRNMLANSPAQRGGTPDEIGALAEFLFHASYITGSDILIDGGVTAAYKYGVLKP